MTNIIDPSKLSAFIGTNYPSPHDTPCLSRERKTLGDLAGLTQYGVNLLRLPPGAWSSQRHWHSHEDEFVYVIEGMPTLVTDSGEEVMQPGQAAGFKAGKADGHHLRNDTDKDVVVLEVGSRCDEDAVEYSDIDMRLNPNSTGQFTTKDGIAYK